MNAQANHTHKKPLISNSLVEGYLLAILRRIDAHNDDESAHIGDALRVVLGATGGAKL